MSDDAFIRSFRGPRDLVEMTRAVSATRMLNLHQLWREQVQEPEYESRPFFAHPILNRSILMKHNIKAGEEPGSTTRRVGATKLLLPLDIHDLTIGAQYLFVGQPNFESQLIKSLDYAKLPLDRDLRLIQMIDRLPTLDPFLLHQMALHYRFDIGQCYFRISQVDIDTMTNFVVSEIEPLVVLCFGLERPTVGQVTKFSDVIMSNQENEDALTILRHGLRMSPLEFSQAIFAWKALLFYKWRMGELAPKVRTTASALAQLQPGRKSGSGIRRVFEKAQGRITDAMVAAWTESRSIITNYDSVYQALVTHGRPEVFRRFLLQAPELFISLGERIGKLEQVSSFWLEELQPQLRTLPAEEVCGLLLDLDATMADGMKPDVPTAELSPNAQPASPDIFSIAANAQA